MQETQVFANIVELVKKYEWNNFLQLKVINLFDNILNNCENEEFRKSALQSSGLGLTLCEMAKTAQFTMESERQIRNGYMAVVVSIANNLIKKSDAQIALDGDDRSVVDYLETVGEEWKSFEKGELKKSNENNKKTLGGSVTKSNTSEEDDKDESNYDVQMEKIMARFTNFNQILSQGANNEEDDDDEEEGTQDSGDKDDGFDEDDDDKKDSDTSSSVSFGNNPDKGSKVEKVNID